MGGKCKETLCWQQQTRLLSSSQKNLRIDSKISSLLEVQAFLEEFVFDALLKFVKMPSEVWVERGRKRSVQLSPLDNFYCKLKIGLE